MKRKYEGIIVLTTRSQEGSMEDLISRVTKDIESEGAKVEKIDNLGRKDFANTPRKISGAHYVTYTITSTPDCIVKIKAKLTLNEAIYLNQFNRVA